MSNKKVSYIAPIRNLNFKLKGFEQNDINFVFDEKHNITLKLFSYHDDIESINADSFSTYDRSSLNFHPYAFYFRCKKEEVENKKLLINLILLSFRIFKKADCNSKYILCLTDTFYSIKYNESWKIADVDSKSATILNEGDIQEIITGYKKLKLFYNLSNRTKHSVQFFYLGYTSYHWMQAFALFMISLETLVSPTTEEQITKTIINRTRNLINNPKICSKNIINNLYQLRSDITHGRILIDLSFKDHINDMSRLQNMAIKAFEIVLSLNFKKYYKNEQSKEEFFRKLEKNNY